MKETRLLMGMPVTVEVLDGAVAATDLEAIFGHFAAIDERFSPYKATSEIAQLNRGELESDHYSDALRTVLALSAATKVATNGYFDIWRDGVCDPSGLVKGWAIQQAAQMLHDRGFEHFVVEAGGDFQVSGLKEGRLWRFGIRNPFNRWEHVKVLALTDCGVATSGTAIRGQHIYDPFHPKQLIKDIVSLTIIGPDVYEADRFATAAFAMGRKGLDFIEQLAGCEGYVIDTHGQATSTSGFERYVAQR